MSPLLLSRKEAGTRNTGSRDSAGHEGIERVAEVSDVVTSWPVVSLFNFCNPKQWPTIPQTAFVEQGYTVYGANGKIGFYTEFNHEKPTVLITCRGATCGTINVCEPKSYVTGNAMALDEGTFKVSGLFELLP